MNLNPGNRETQADFTERRTRWRQLENAIANCQDGLTRFAGFLRKSRIEMPAIRPTDPIVEVWL